MSLAPLDPRRERWSLFLLTAAQFTHILDFMILMPLGPQLMRAFQIETGKFNLLVSAYSISAGIAGFIATVFLDRFDRKRSYLWIYAGFAVATLGCAFTDHFYTLLVARIVAGAFGGVTNSQVLAIVSDLVPLERRGKAIGLIMSGFSLASIAGVPAGLFLAGQGDWHLPFIALGALSFLVLAVTIRVLPALPPHPAPGGWRAILQNLVTIATTPNHVRAFAFMIVISFAAFMIFPSIASSLVKNSGFPEDSLVPLYFVGGCFTIVVTNVAGRAADLHGRLRVFRVAAISSILPMMVLTHLPVVPPWISIAVVTCFMCLSSARFVPAMAMITGSVEPRYRAGFMSLNSALQQIAGGLSAMLAASILTETADGRVLNYGWLGWISAALVLATLYLGGRVRVAEQSPLPAGLGGKPAPIPPAPKS